MKTKLALIASLCCGFSAVGSAFTLDFISVPLGTTVPPSLTINVTGYGDVRFDPIGGSTLVVDNTYQSTNPATPSSPSLNFGPGEGVTITFLAAEPTMVQFNAVGSSPGEFFLLSPGGNANEFTYVLNGTASPLSDGGAGLYTVSFEQVPEPSAALLGVLGASLLVIRRKR